MLINDLFFRIETNPSYTFIGGEIRLQGHIKIISRKWGSGIYQTQQPRKGVYLHRDDVTLHQPIIWFVVRACHSPRTPWLGLVPYCWWSLFDFLPIHLFAHLGLRLTHHFLLHPVLPFNLAVAHCSCAPKFALHSSLPAWVGALSCQYKLSWAHSWNLPNAAAASLTFIHSLTHPHRQSCIGVLTVCCVLWELVNETGIKELAFTSPRLLS